MERVKVELEAMKESYELGKAVEQILGAIGEALKDGKWDWASDMPAVITGALISLPKAIEGADLVDDEFGEDAMGVVNGMAIPVMAGVAKLLSGIKEGKKANEVVVE